MSCMDSPVLIAPARTTPPPWGLLTGGCWCSVRFCWAGTGMIYVLYYAAAADRQLIFFFPVRLFISRPAVGSSYFILLTAEKGRSAGCSSPLSGNSLQRMPICEAPREGVFYLLCFLTSQKTLPSTVDIKTFIEGFYKL